MKRTITPGPWRMAAEREARMSIIASGCVPIYAPNDPTPGYAGHPRPELAFAFVGGAGRDPEQILADARAVEALPEAIDMLRQVERWMSGYGTTPQPEIRGRVRALLARLEG